MSNLKFWNIYFLFFPTPEYIYIYVCMYIYMYIYIATYIYIYIYIYILYMYIILSTTILYVCILLITCNLFVQTKSFFCNLVIIFYKSQLVCTIFQVYFGNDSFSVNHSNFRQSCLMLRLKSGAWWKHPLTQLWWVTAKLKVICLIALSTQQTVCYSIPLLVVVCVVGVMYVML